MVLSAIRVLESMVATLFLHDTMKGHTNAVMTTAAPISLKIRRLRLI